MKDTADRTPWRLLGVVILVAALFRLPFLVDFPIVEPDEGLWTISSKNWITSGDWFVAGRTHFLLSPVFHLINVVLFGLLGPSIGAARLLNAIAGIGSAALLFELVRRTTTNVRLAFVGALLFSMSEWTVIWSRRAMIEPLELCLALVAFLGAVSPGRRGIVTAAIAMALSILTKANAVVMLPGLAAFAIWGMPTVTGLRPSWEGVRRAAAILFGAVGIALAVYGVLYLTYPEQFLRAFGFELTVGEATGGTGGESARVSRFGPDLVLTGRAILTLFREDPFLFVLASLGIGLAVFDRRPVMVAFGAWMLSTFGMTAIQRFQPQRYYYLAAPALAFLAAVALDALGKLPEGSPQGRRLIPRRLVAVLAVVGLFEVAYVGLGLLGSDRQPPPAAAEWMKANAAPSDTVLAAAYFCTDIPNPCLEYYFIAPDTLRLQGLIESRRIAYILFDTMEWPPSYEPYLRARFPVVQQWGFGKVFAVPDSARR